MEIKTYCLIIFMHITNNGLKLILSFTASCCLSVDLLLFSNIFFHRLHPEGRIVMRSQSNFWVGMREWARASTKGYSMSFISPICVKIGHILKPYKYHPRWWTSSVNDAMWVCFRIVRILQYAWSRWRCCCSGLTGKSESAHLGH